MKTTLVLMAMTEEGDETQLGIVAACPTVSQFVRSSATKSLGQDGLPLLNTAVPFALL